MRHLSFRHLSGIEFPFSVYNASRDAYGRRPWRYVLKDDGVGAYLGVVADDHSPEDLGTGPNIDMAADSGKSWFRSRPQSHLLQDQTVWPYDRIRVDDHALRVKNNDSTAEPGIDGYVAAADHRPETVPQDDQRSDQSP
jgi:hypothetical protein